MRILITVKTYPILSKKYAELVCTAGINSNGEWIRIYPVKFRALQDENKYKKYQWIEVEIKESASDKRPETYRISGGSEIKLLGDPLPTDNKWQARKNEFIDKVHLHEDLAKIIKKAHRNELSLALFKPTKWLKFHVEKVAKRESRESKLAKLQADREQLDFFKDQETINKEFSVVEELPYKFSYSFEDREGKETKLMIEDWEIGALYRNCSKSSNNEESTCEKVRKKFWEEFINSDKYNTYLILGTTLKWHNMKAPNPFVIVGVVPVLDDLQLGLKI